MSPLYYIYYCETNLICIGLSIFVIVSGLTHSRSDGIDDSFTRIFAWINIFYCISDIFASVFQGTDGLLAKYILYLVNIFYVSTPLFYAYSFIEYSHLKLRGIELHKTKYGKLILSPLFLCFVLMITTPITNFGFIINEKNLYERGIGGYIIPAVSWIFFILTTIMLINRIIHAGSYVEKENLKPLSRFAIFPFIATIIQLNLYGVTVSQVGFTFTILIFYVTRLKNQILSDELTDLNNRRDFNIYISNFIENDDEKELYICMIDVNNFRDINDAYGRTEGDLVLRRISQIIRDTCKGIDHNIFVCRYGGDEFVIANKNNSQLEIDTIKMTIKEKMQQETLHQMKDYDFSVSIGSAYGYIETFPDYLELLEKATADISEDKKRMHIFSEE